MGPDGVTDPGSVHVENREVLVSRSTRVSRPLIALLGLVIVLGIFFTVHKLKKAGATDAHKPVASVLDVPVKPKAAFPKPASGATQPAAEQSSQTTAAEDALVTRTPTERASPETSTERPSIRHASDSESTSANQSQSISASTTEPSSTSTATADAAPEANRAAAAPTIVVSTQSVAEAKAKMDSGDLLTARQIANEALISGRLADADADAARQLLIEINKAIVFSNRKFPDDPWGGIYKVVSGERMATIAAKNGITWELISRVNGVEPRRMRYGQALKIFKGPFHAVVTKHLFRMDIYLGNPGGAGSMFVTSFPVGLGKDNSTPTGLWLCRSGDKIRHPKYFPPPGSGGQVLAADDPKNPLGGYWIALQGQDGQAVGKESYGIHGTIDPDSIGKQESMGCIRLRSEDISWVFDLLVDGKSKVVVKD